MKLRDSFDGSGRFEGDRALRWRSIPADARIVSAKATVTPIDANQGGPFAERLGFTDGVGEQGVTKVLAGTWVEVDFHARRTLARVVGSNLNLTTLQVDLGGGAYVEINKAGALKTPDPPPNNFFTLTDDSSPLPALTVTKFKLTGSTLQPDLVSVIIRSVPTNVSLRVGDLAPFWTHLGELTDSETSPDFGAVLQAALANAKVDNGFYDLLLTVHSDTIARLQIDLEIEFLVQQDPLPNGLPEVVLPFDFSTLPQSTAATLNVAVPPNSRVVPGQTTARVRGNFVESRVARGPTGDVNPVAAVEVSPSSAQAQIIALGKDITATAIDLLIESTTPATYLRLDVRDDLDGKPGDTSLLAKPVEFSVDQQAGKGAHWTSVPLTAEFVFSRSEPAKPGLRPQRYWLVLQSLEGMAAWNVDKARDGAKDSAQTRDEGNSVDDEAAEALNMQTTRDGGLSWRDAIAMPGTLLDKTIASSGPFTAFFRLRTQPRTFKVPIVLQAGRDQSEVRVKLDRFQPLGRVDFALDTELAQGINDSLKKAPPATSTDTEHLHNRDFERWLRIGDDVKRQPEIQVDAPIRAIAFSPDGSLAYVLDQTPLEPGFIVVVDVACNRQIEDSKITLTITNPKAFVISPDGTRAYVIDDGVGTQQLLQIVDLVNHKPLGKPVDLGLATSNEEKPASDLALSPDGALLYILTLVTPDTTSKENHLRVIDTARLEQQLAAGGILRSVLLAADPGQTQSPKALAVSPDGSLLYMLSDRGSGNAAVEICDVTTFTLLGPPIVVGPGATALALTSDGTRAVVANELSNNVSVIDTATGTATAVTVGQPIDVAVSPDGRLAYALNKGGKSISPIDLSRQAAGKDFPAVDLALGRVPVALALAPLGDQIYVAANTDIVTISSISPIQFGARLPDEWQLTSGAVIPYCLGDPFHLVAVLGSDSMPTGLSQVVPVVESGSYEFSFWGISWESDTNEPPAAGEVLWLGANCGPLGTDPVPIEVFGDRPTLDPLKGLGGSLFAASAVGRAPSLELHRVRLTAPAGANQAEVRFTVPSSGAAAIDRVSLTTTSEATANADFKLQKEGRLVGWTVSPGVAPGFSVLAADEGIQLRNAGAATAELLQVVAAKKGEPFILEFQGKAVAGPTSQTNPQVELRWLKTDGTPTASPTNIEIRPDGLGSSVATGAVPDDATQVEIHLSVPAGATLEVKRASLRFLTPTIVPVTFIAEAPGELTVSDIRVAFDRIEPAAPPIPDGGLCIPTPPGREPGETDEDCCFCHHCESERTMVEAKPVMTAAGRPAMMASCGICGNELLRAGGPGVLGTQPLPLALSGATAPTVIRSASRTAATALFEVAAKALRLTDIRGIGEARAKQLTDVGIDSVEKLAASTPQSVAKIKYITLIMASQIIAEARSRLTRP